MSDSIPLTRPRLVGRLAAALLALGLVAHLHARPAGAQTIEGILSQLMDVQNAVITAAVQSQAGDKDAALATIDGALAMLQALEVQLDDPAAADAVGSALKRLRRGVDATEKKIARARAVVDRKVVIPLSKFKVAAKSVLRAARVVGRPVVAEIDARSAGFHRPGDEVRFQIYNADGTPCTETPVVEVANAGSSPAIDLGSVLVDETTGVITLFMGEGQGAGRVTVTACGQSATVLLYNYGPRVPAGLPRGFPTNLTPGTYRMTYSASGPGVSIPETLIGTFELTDLRTFATEIVQAFRAAAQAVSSVPGCGQSVNYSPFNGTSFSVNYTVTCTVATVSVTVRLVFRVEKI
jgi:hypothetical protein